MRNSICFVFFLLFVCACSSAPVQEEANIPYQHADLRIPVEDIESLQNDGFIAKMEDGMQINKPKIWEQPEPTEWDLAEPPSLAFCGTSYLKHYKSDSFTDEAKFRVVGATEDWIPLEGKVTRVLHLKLVNNW